MLRQIFWRTSAWFGIFLALFVCAGSGFADQRKYAVSGTKADSLRGTEYTLEELEALGAHPIKSSYFDRAMNYNDSRLRVIALSLFADQFHPGGKADALLLNCFDDYQGIISMEDIRRYDLKLATAIELRPEFKAPGWLNPLLIVVPDGSEAPYHERFMTANIRELRFVRLDDYYAPLREIARTSAESLAGFKAFTDNCVFCHSLKGIGGNKGIKLTATYDFSRTPDVSRFVADFKKFHGKDNPDKQNISQFVTETILRDIALFLKDDRLKQK